MSGIGPRRLILLTVVCKLNLLFKSILKFFTMHIKQILGICNQVSLWVNDSDKNIFRSDFRNWIISNRKIDLELINALCPCLVFQTAISLFFYTYDVNIGGFNRGNLSNFFI